MARLHEAPQGFRPKTLHLVTSFAAFALVASGVLYMIIARPPVAQAPDVANAPAVPVDHESVLEVAYDRAGTMIRDRDFAKAYVTLAESVDGVKADPLLGVAHQLMANLAFEELQWYPEAYANYNALRLNSNSEFQRESTNLLRLNLLDESRARDINYDSLHALDAARRFDSLEELEGVLARYPATYVASLAAQDMARLSVAEDMNSGAPVERLAAMEAALRNSTHPIAQKQLQIEIAHVYRELNDADRARDFYEEVAQGGHTQLAELARASLAEMKAARQ